MITNAAGTITEDEDLLSKNAIPSPGWIILAHAIIPAVWDGSPLRIGAPTPAAAPYADLSDPQALNQYSYVRNIRPSRTDPNGHFTIGGKQYGFWALPWACSWSYRNRHGAEEENRGRKKCPASERPQSRWLPVDQPAAMGSPNRDHGRSRCDLQTNKSKRCRDEASIPAFFEEHSD